MKTTLLTPLIRMLLGLGAARSNLQRLPILIFHRVRQRRDPLLPSEIDSADFDRILRLLSRCFTVLTVGEASTLLQAGRLPPRALCITFDDGYADNAEVALPLLQKYGMRASFFVSSGFIDGGRMWNDSVIECVRLSQQQSADLQELGEGFTSAEDLSNVPARRALLERLLARVKYLTPEQREAMLDVLQQALGVERLPDDLMLKSAQLKQLRDAGMEIGAHTVIHPILTTLPPEQARQEILEGRQALERILGQVVEVFAYPNGRPGKDYDASHAAMVRDLGFKAAVSTAPGIATQGDDNVQLPRFTPWRSPGSLAWALQLVKQYRASYAKA